MSERIGMPNEVPNVFIECLDAVIRQRADGGERMIDKARILQLLSDARWATSNAHPEWRRKQAAEQARILEDNLAMRGIVEALAERDPYGEFEDACPRLCQWCYEAEEAGHAPDCEWANARALVGPASERTEAGE